MWNTATDRRTAPLTVGGPVDTVAFSPDGNNLAVGDDSRYVVLWDVKVDRRIARRVGNPLRRVAFSPDGAILVTGDISGTVNIWKKDDWQRFARLGESGAITSLTFSPRSHVLAIGSLGGSIVLLRQNLINLTPAFFSDLICGAIRENLGIQLAQYPPGQPYQCPDPQQD